MASKLSFSNSSVLVGISIFIILALVLFACTGKKKPGSRSRLDVRADIKVLSGQYQKNPTNQQTAITYARRLFESGDFQKSKEIVTPLLQADPTVDVLWLSANHEYNNGNYKVAEQLLRGMLGHDKVSPQQKVEAEVGLTFVHYQTGEYQKSSHLFKGLEGAIDLPIWELMKSFGSEKPYQIEWHSKLSTETPFLIHDPLPVIAVEINGKPIYVIIDTGGETFYLDTEVAGSLGIRPVTQNTEMFAGGKETIVGYARADSLKIGDVTLNSIPIKTGPISRFSEIIADKTYPISGVLGTGELRQFLPTLDYLNGKLVLRPKTEIGMARLAEEIESMEVKRVPFWLALTHILIVKGAINNQEGLAFFVDSGLADSAAGVLLPKQTLELIGRPLPEMEKIPENHGGLGGGGFSIGRFSVDTLKVGDLTHKNMDGLYGVFPDDLYWACQFIVDGIISHRLLEHYAWTIDFTNMEMIFAK